MIIQMIREEITDEISQTVHSYVEDMEETRNRMREQVREFNSYLHKVQQENNKISSRSVLITSLTLATLAELHCSGFMQMLSRVRSSMQI